MLFEAKASSGGAEGAAFVLAAFALAACAAFALAACAAFALAACAAPAFATCVGFRFALGGAFWLGDAFCCSSRRTSCHAKQHPYHRDFFPITQPVQYCRALHVRTALHLCAGRFGSS